MAYKTVRRNGRDVLINTATGKEVRPGERVANELRYIGQGINDNFTYSDKVDARSGRRLTPKEVRTAEGTKPKASKPAAKPATKSTAKGPKNGDTTIKEGNKFVFKDGYWKKAEKPAATKPARTTSSGSGGGSARTYASSSTRTTTASVTEPKPIPKPAGKVPASSETYRDGGKGLYQGSKEYRDKVGGSGNPLLNRFRKDMGRNTDTGAKTDGVGPVASGSDYAKSKNISQAQSDANKARIKQGPGPKNETLKERMERMKKRRQGTSIGGVD